MTLFRPLFMQAAGGDPAMEYTGQEFRLMLSSIWETEGVIASAFKVSQRAAGANMSVDVAGGQAVITGNDVTSQGTYVVTSNAVENLTVPAAPGAGSRIHRVILTLKDKLYNGTVTTYEFLPELQEDTGSGVPAIPDSAIPLALISVAASQTSVLDAHITDARINAMPKPGRARVIADTTGRPGIPLESELFWRQDTDVHEVYDGSAYREIPHRDGGGSEWSTYTPVLTGTTGNPTLGVASTASGRYIRIGRTVTARVVIVFGTSGTAAGSGFYEVTLPVTARTTTPGRQAIGSAYVRNNPVGDFFDGIAFVEPSVGSRCRISIDSDVVTSGVPFAWSVGDELGFTVTYEAAS